MQPWLAHIDITEFTETIPRERSTMGGDPECGALPAQAFRNRYPFGCLRWTGHAGPHSPIELYARRLDERDRRRKQP